MGRSDLSGSRIGVTAFDWVPDFAQGNVRDIRVRWALEEAGLPYEAIVIEQGTQSGTENVARQPFGQVPAIELGDETLFESGAIVWTIATMSDRLLPSDEPGRRRCLSWLIAALNSVEPPLMDLATLDFFPVEDEVKRLHRPYVLNQVEGRLTRLQDALGSRDYLVGDAFSAADLMMTAVLGIARHTDILTRFPALEAYVARNKARPAYQRALETQLRPFRENAARYERAA